MQVPTPPIECGYDREAVDTRIRAFLTSRFETDNCRDDGDDDFSSRVALDEHCITGLNRFVSFLVTEITGEAQNAAKASWRDRMVPSDLRISIFNDRELLALFQYSKVYWEGR